MLDENDDDDDVDDCSDAPPPYLVLSNIKNPPRFGRLAPYVNSERQVSNVSVFLSGVGITC
jgi:hypothetical protein